MPELQGGIKDIQEQCWSATLLCPEGLPMAKWTEGDPEEGGSSNPSAQHGAVQPGLPFHQNVAFPAYLVTTSCVSSRGNMKKDS